MYDDVYAETDCANLIIVFRQLYFTRKVAQQRPTAPAVAGRAATKPKNSNTRRRTASMPTILPSPASPRNPQLSPLQVRSLLCQLGKTFQRIGRRSTPPVLFCLRHASLFCTLFFFFFHFFFNFAYIFTLAA